MNRRAQYPKRAESEKADMSIQERQEREKISGQWQERRKINRIAMRHWIMISQSKQEASREVRRKGPASRESIARNTC